MPATTSAVYNSLLRELLDAAPVNELGPGSPQERQRSALRSLSFSQLLAPHPVADRAMATACCAGLWLRFDFLDEAHSLSQAIESHEGNYWHAIMHRREPDFGNAKYWFRRVGAHAVHPALHVRAREVAGLASLPGDARFLLEQDAWDAFAFVDLCEIALDAAPPLHNLCKHVQLCEWELLFDYCYRRAGGLD
jgi:hypothetical protein